MLTQNDLQAIGKIFDNKFDSRLTGIEKRLDSMEIKIGSLEVKMGLFEEKMGLFEEKMGLFEEKMSLFEEKMSLFENKLTSLDNKMNRGFKSVDKKLNVIINYFDHQDINTRKRLNRIELHLGLTS